MTVYDDKYMRNSRWRRLCERKGEPGERSGHVDWYVERLRRGDATPKVQAEAADLLLAFVGQAEYLDARALRLEFGDGKVALPTQENPLYGYLDT